MLQLSQNSTGNSKDQRALQSVWKPPQASRRPLGEDSHVEIDIDESSIDLRPTDARQNGLANGLQMKFNHNDEEPHCLTEEGVLDGDRRSLFTGLYIRGKGLNADQIEAIDQNLLEVSISKTRDRNGAGSICDTNHEVSIAGAGQRRLFGSVLKTQADDEDIRRRLPLQADHLDDRFFNFETAGPEREREQKDAQRR